VCAKTLLVMTHASSRKSGGWVGGRARTSDDFLKCQRSEAVEGVTASTRQEGTRDSAIFPEMEATNLENLRNDDWPESGWTFS